MTANATNGKDFSAWVTRHSPVVIDGGLATLCESLGANIDSALWSSALIKDGPGMLVRAHRAFLDALS